MFNQIVRNLKHIKDSANDLREYVEHFSLQSIERKYFIVITRERTGSTCLLDLLASHPNIKADPHIFYNYTKLPKEFEKPSQRSRKNILGFKFKIQPSNFDLTAQNQFEAAQNLSLLEKRGIKIIYLERKNLLRQSVSWLLADCAKLKRQNYKKGQTPLKINSMNFDAHTLLARIQLNEQISDFEKCSLTDIPYLHLIYEEDLLFEDKHQSTLDKICDFLEIEHARVITRYARISTGDLRQSFSNYEEIDAFLRSTQYGDQLDW